MKKIAIVTLAVALENEKGYSRFRFLANLLSDYYDVHLITSTFQHWEKKQRDEKRIESVSRRYQVKLAYDGALMATGKITENSLLNFV